LIAAETDWGTIAEVGTATGTLVLAVATFLATRAANRSARLAERSQLIGMRPVLVPSREADPAEEVMWGDDHKIVLGGGVGWAEVAGENVYLAIAVRNVGPGLAILRGWRARPEVVRNIATVERPNPDEFTSQLRDLYVPAGDVSYWQASLRPNDDVLHSDEDLRVALKRALEQRDGVTIDLLYNDAEGSQPTMSRFAVRPREGESEGAAWRATVVRHWRV
jgi:predicted exporter